jgi:hypothetical protein
MFSRARRDWSSPCNPSRRAFVLATVSCWVILGWTAGCAEVRPEQILQVGEHDVDILGPVTSPRHVELNDKFMRALERDPEWREAVRSHPAGSPLPYDSRSGLTRSEYDEMLALSEKLTHGKVGEGKLRITTLAPDVYALEGDDRLPNLIGIEVDLASNVVRTPLGEATECTDVDMAADSLLGAWAGKKWTLSKPRTADQEELRVELMVGKLTQSGQGLLVYRVHRGGRGGKSVILETIRFDIPKSD